MGQAHSTSGSAQNAIGAQHGDNDVADKSSRLPKLRDKKMKPQKSNILEVDSSDPNPASTILIVAHGEYIPCIKGWSTLAIYCDTSKAKNLGKRKLPDSEDMSLSDLLEQVRDCIHKRFDIDLPADLVNILSNQPPEGPAYMTMVCVIDRRGAKDVDLALTMPIRDSEEWDAAKHLMRSARGISLVQVKFATKHMNKFWQYMLSKAIIM